MGSRFGLSFGLMLLIAINIVDYGEATGSWEILHENAGIASMHTAVTHFGTVVMLDRTNIGASKIDLPNGRCRDNPLDEALTHDCTAHSVMFTPGPNAVRPLFIQTDTWCSSGQFTANGTLVQTGGFADGYTKVSYLVPCPANGSCDWVEEPTESLQDGRWYASNQLLPDNTQIVVGGLNVFTSEFVPRNSRPSNLMPFLVQTDDFETDNLYPFLYLLPDDSLFIFANRDSIIYNYQLNIIMRKFPTIPGEPRNYPAGGSSVMLPLTAADDFSNVEVLICGGAREGAFFNASAYFPASQTCGRMSVTSPDATWLMEDMPIRRTMGDMILLPTSHVLIINGAQNGCQGFNNANNPALNPVLYDPYALAGERFSVLTPTTIPRMYHCTANLLPDGRILVAGSNPHKNYVFSGDFPTELRVEAFSPEYLHPAHNWTRPWIVRAPKSLRYNQTFRLTIEAAALNRSATMPSAEIELNLVSAPFATHSFSQGQRLIQLSVTHRRVLRGNRCEIKSVAPPAATIAPPSFYMLFAVHQGIPSIAAWVRIHA